MPTSSRRRQRDAGELAILFVLLARLHAEYKRLPIQPGPVTTVLLLFMVAVHLIPEALPPLSACCISSAHVWDAIFSSRNGWEALLWGQRTALDRASEIIRRLVLSTVIHVDDFHLYYNSVSLLWKGGMLEDKFGMESFSRFVAFAIGASGAIAVLLGVAAEHLELGTLHCAVGFSGVLYAMSAVALHQDPSGPAFVHGIPIKRRYAIWLEVVVSSLLHHRVSLFGHLAGAIAGVLWCAAPRQWGFVSQAWSRHNSRRYNYGGGRVGGNGSNGMHQDEHRYRAVD